MAGSIHHSNGTMLQGFEWHTFSAPSHWLHLTSLLPQFAKLGITSIWLPPGCKANNPNGNGYDVYDLWDLGEFEQKGARSTKWGSREELDELLKRAKRYGVDLIWDAVLSHKQSGDRLEGGVWAVEVDEEDRRYEICSPKQIEAWLKYNFPGREKEGMKYSAMKWRAEHFNGTDWDQSRQRNAIYKLIDDPCIHSPFEQPKKPIAKSPRPPLSRISMLRRRWSNQTSKAQQLPAVPARRPGKGWAEDVDKDRGNNDYLLFTNIDYTNPEVRKDVLKWGRWMVEDVGVHGFRLDAARHFSFNFTRDWIQHIHDISRQRGGRDAFVVGEVWDGEVHKAVKWLDAMQRPDRSRAYAYDSPLLYNFSRISEDFRTRSRNLDLRTITRDSLVQCRPHAAVTLVTNHDTQMGQRCYTPMDAKLKALFYAFILLRREGYPCVFWGDLYGTNGPHEEKPACLVPNRGQDGGKRNLLSELMMCRKFLAYGEQRDYWDSPNCIGWTRTGETEGVGCAVVLNLSTTTATKKMQIGKSGEVWVDVLEMVTEQVKIDAQASGSFPCRGAGVSVFVRKDSQAVLDFFADLDTNIYRA